MFTLIFYVLCCVLVGALATNWNRSGYWWCIISLFITPIFGAMIVLILKLCETPKNETD
jgi:hypothetical protein